MVEPTLDTSVVVEPTLGTSVVTLDSTGTDGTLLGTFEAAGTTIQEKYCRRENAETGAIMFPPAPNLSSFIDAFHRDTLSNKEKIEKQRQDEYEAEVEVFRALEKEENIIVLHGLKYTHDQYKECVPLHAQSDCKKRDQEEEGECDFVVIGDKFLVVLEVKSPDMNSKNPEKMFSDRYRESIHQRTRTLDLIRGVFQQTCSTEGPVIFDFSIFNRLTKDDVGKFEKYQKLSSDDKKTIVLKDDMINFREWWKDNILSKVTADMQPLENRPINVLLALWSADNKNMCKTEDCSLTHCILEIDERLKSEKITRVPKGPINKEIKGASPVFKKYLGIECLTAEQADIFKSKKTFLWINGPAGSGKSILLLGKIIDLFEKMRAKVKREGGTSTERDKCLLLAFGEQSLDNYKPALEKAGLKSFSFCLGIFDEISINMTSASEIVEALQAVVTDEDYDVLVVYSVSGASVATLEHFTSLFSLFQDHNIFIDDAHCLFSYNFDLITEDKVVTFLDKLKESNDGYIIWTSMDIAQFSYHSVATEMFRLMRHVTNTSLTKHLKDSLVTLSANLRNTVEIADLLKALRSEVLNSLGDHIGIPLQTRGHFIHGFIPKIYVIKDSMRNFVEHVLDIELGKLKELSPNTAGYVYKQSYALSKSWGEMQTHQRGTKGHLSNIPSTEWPAVVAYVCESRSTFDDIKSELYLAVSRGRVYCVTVLLIDPESDVHLELSDFLERLGSFADIIHL